MQRSSIRRQRAFLRRLISLASLAALLIAGVVPSARAAQPITVTARALQRSASDPSGLTYVAVTSLKPGDVFMYAFDLQPKNDPSTPMLLDITFDARLDMLSMGTDGACVGLTGNIHTLSCRDQHNQFGGAQPVHMSVVWVWFRVQPSTFARTVLMQATTPNDSKVISIPFVPLGKLYFPVFMFRH